MPQILADEDSWQQCGRGIDAVLQHVHNISDYAREACPMALLTCAAESVTDGVRLVGVRFYWATPPMCLMGPTRGRAAGLSRS